MISNKTILTGTKVLGVIFAIYGLIVLSGVLLTIIGTGGVMQAQQVAEEGGIDLGVFPYELAILGTVIFFLLSLAYLITSYGLFKLARWTPLGLYSISIFGLAYFVFGVLTVGVPASIFEVIFSFIYFGFGLYIRNQKAIFKN